MERAHIVLASADGVAGSAICQRFGVSRPTVTCWLDRYEADGVAGLVTDHPRSGRPKQITLAEEDAIIDRTLHTKPPKDATHWSTRLMAEITGHHHATIARICRTHGVKPHRVKMFKLSTDLAFVTKLQDVVGLYLHPPERAVVFAFDEKSQIQALDRTQPGLPPKKGRAGTRTHDDKRHGTTTLFAALDVATGTVLQDCMPHHRHQEFLKFLRQMDRSVAPELALQVILDNYATHKHPKVQRWLTRHLDPVSLGDARRAPPRSTALHRAPILMILCQRVWTNHCACWIADDNLPALHVLHDDGSRADHGIFTDHDRLADHRSGSHMGPIADVNPTRKPCAGRHVDMVADAAVVFHDCPCVDGHVDPEYGTRIDDAPREELTPRTNRGPIRACGGWMNDCQRLQLMEQTEFEDAAACIVLSRAAHADNEK